jgi:NADPH-dependent 2,4-dienoyl-CoA reductase/sulfur reductase-like enzyme
VKKVKAIPEIEVSLRSFVVRLDRDKTVTYLKPGRFNTVKPRALIMATGCRERTREMIHVPGTRPSGIFSAGLAQRLINIEGYLPGKNVVIIGSGDNGLIMARRFTFQGAKVKAIVEIQSKTRGLARNVVQCVDDFDIPMYFSHKVIKIYGHDRVEKIVIARIDESFNQVPGTEITIECDTVLVSVGLIPENELIEMAGVVIDRKTNSPVSNEVNKTSIPGIFICGNSFKVYDYVDSVTKDSELAGKLAAEYLKSSNKGQR